jgi:hypothetical protein
MSGLPWNAGTHPHSLQVLTYAAAKLYIEVDEVDARQTGGTS